MSTYLPAYTVHKGSGKNHVVILTTSDRSEAEALARFESQLSDDLITLEVTA